MIIKLSTTPKMLLQTLFLCSIYTQRIFHCQLCHFYLPLWKIIFMKKLLFWAIIAATSLSQAATIYQIDINDNIGSKTWVYTKRGFSEAEALNANLVLLRLNTYGGELSFADSIRTQILNSDIQTVAFIDNNAASAGALISIACDRIYMRKGASLGAATVVAGTDGQQMPDKYQSYMRATMRSTAEAHGKDSLGRWKRDPLIAEAMVDNHTVIPTLLIRAKRWHSPLKKPLPIATAKVLPKR